MFATVTGHPHWNVPPGAEPVPPCVPSFGYVQITGAALARFRAFPVSSVSRNVYVPSGGRMSLITYWPCAVGDRVRLVGVAHAVVVVVGPDLQRGNPGSPASR